MASEQIQVTMAPTGKNGPNPGVTDAKPLREFNKLSPNSYLFDPDLMDEAKKAQEKARFWSPEGQTGPGSPPDLIILCSWMGAATKHIAKYTTPYVSKFPDTPILLIRSDVLDLTFTSTGQQIQRLKPAVSAIQRYVNLIGAKNIRVLLHAFSNGGSWTACMLAAAYKRTAAKDGSKTDLPISAMIIDSAPSLPHVRLAVNAMRETLGKSVLVRIVGGFFIYVFILLSWVLDHVGYRQNILVGMRAKLNDPSGPFLGGDIPRLYICSRTDEMVPMDDVIAHAEEARSQLGKSGVKDADGLVKIEEFTNSRHVGHMMADRPRYWKLVDEHWASADAFL